MKKLRAILICSLLMFSFAGCGVKPDDHAEKTKETTESVIEEDETTESTSEVEETTEEVPEETKQSASDYIRSVMDPYVDKYFDGDAERTYLYGLNYAIMHSSRTQSAEAVEKKDLDWYYQKYGFEGYLDYLDYAYTTAGFDYSKYKEMYETAYEIVKTTDKQTSATYQTLMLAPCLSITPEYANFDNVLEINVFTKERLAEYQIDMILDYMEPDNTYDYMSTTSAEEFFSDSHPMLPYLKKLYAKMDELYEKYENDEIMDPLMKFELPLRGFDPDEFDND